MQKSSRKAKKNKQRVAKVPSSPPSLVDVLRVGVTLRYSKTSSSDASVYTNCMGKLICASTAATTAFCVYESIRVRRVTVWGLGIVNNSAGGFNMLTNVVTLRFDDSPIAPFGQERRVTDVGASSSKVPCVSLKTSGMFANWIDADNSVSVTGQRMMLISGPQGSTIDVKCTIQLIVSKTSAFTTLSGGGMTACKLYYNYLDSTSSAGAAGTQFLLNINSSNSTALV